MLHKLIVSRSGTVKRVGADPRPPRQVCALHSREAQFLPKVDSRPPSFSLTLESPSTR